MYLDEGRTIPLKQNGDLLRPVSFNNITNIKESIKTVNAGAQGGLGIQYPLGPGSIFLESRAVIGITNIQTHPESDGKNQTGSLIIAVGYFIRIHR